MDDIQREHEWQPGIRAAEQIPPGEQRVGTTRKYESSFMGKRLVNAYVNTIYEPNRHVAYESTPSSHLQAKGDVKYETVPEGTRVTMRIDAEIPRIMRLVPKSLFDKLSRKELRESLQRLKSNLEK